MDTGMGMDTVMDLHMIIQFRFTVASMEAEGYITSSIALEEDISDRMVATSVIRADLAAVTTEVPDLAVTVVMAVAVITDSASSLWPFLSFFAPVATG